MIWLWFLVFIISLFLLIKFSDFFTDAAEQIGLYFKLPHFIIGVTIVAIGTSLPELASSIAAIFANNSEIVIGNVLGSNIANILLILGIAAIFAKKISVTREIWKIDLPLLIGSTALLYLIIINYNIDFIDTIILLFGFIVYLTYVMKTGKEDIVLNQESKEFINNKKAIFKEWILLIVSIFVIFYSAKYVIASLVNIANYFNVSASIIAVIALAIGTSLPELTVSIVAAKKGKAELAIGNILGSNIFNIFGVIGISSIFGNIVISKTIFAVVVPTFLISTILFLFITQDREVTEWEGWVLILLYFVFINLLF